jgi:hypothetical protein
MLILTPQAAPWRLFDDYHDEGANHVREMFPELAAFVLANYHVGKKFGNFHVLRWNTSD